MTAINRLQYLHNRMRKYYWVVEGDIRACFDEISHKRLMQVLRKVVNDERLLSLISCPREQTYSWNGGMCLRYYLQRIANCMDPRIVGDFDLPDLLR
jgi:hypothetical protein